MQELAGNYPNAHDQSLEVIRPYKPFRVRVPYKKAL